MSETQVTITKTSLEKQELKELKKLQKISISVPNLLLAIKSLAALLRASISLSESIKTMSEQSNDQNLNKIFAYMHKEVEEGSKLGDVMRLFPRIFSETVISVVDAGEKGGSLEKNLLFIAETLKKNYELQRKMKGAIIYPCIIIGLTIVEFIGMIFIVLPRMENLYSTFPDPPALTLFIMNAAQSIRDNWLIIAIVIFVLLLLFSIFLRTKQGNIFLSWLALHFPILNRLFVNNTLASFSRTLGVLLASGIPLSKALKISTNTVNNYMYSKVLESVYNDIKSGKNLALALSAHPDYFNKSFIKMVEIGEMSGTLEENLMYLHEYYSEEVTEMANNIVTVIEPLLLILVGVIIGLLGVTILMPIYQLMGSINE
jgi:type IV pilus assembly protein PilC